LSIIIYIQYLFCEPQESNAGGEADFSTKLKSSDYEPEESNPGGGADFSMKLKSSDYEPEESNPGGGADFSMKLKSSYFVILLIIIEMCAISINIKIK
jgi:hypothetical protein